jgi:nitrite reductase/ring-hydroxylating ferredoxin subunit
MFTLRSRAGPNGADFERVCATHEVAPGRLRAAELEDGTRICLANAAGRITAVSDRCPHQQSRLSDGELSADGAIVCQRHGAAYDCVTGRSVRGPIRSRGEREAPLGRLTTFEVHIADGHIFVRRPEAASD